MRAQAYRRRRTPWYWTPRFARGCTAVWTGLAWTLAIGLAALLVLLAMAGLVWLVSLADLW